LRCTVKGGDDPKKLQSSHAYIAKNLPIVISQQLALSKIATHNPAWIIGHARRVSEEIEVLAPAVRRGGTRPDNCEYPWEDARGRIQVPADCQFKPSRLLLERAGRVFLKLVLDAIQRLQR
jgi:hypothetical protein